MRTPGSVTRSEVVRLGVSWIAFLLNGTATLVLAW